MPAQQEQKSGVIDSFYDTDSGIIKEDVSATKLDFYQQGAQVEFNQADSVTYLKITLPNGRIIVTDIKKKT